MYATLDIIKGSKHSGKLIGVHQKLDKAARQLIGREMGRDARIFPSIEKILYFEGTRGPDGIKAKSPGVDEPEHFIQPEKDDGVLRQYILNHQYNLTQALINNNHERAAFEAAWMAHAITDGLTPAHHYPFREIVDELMTDKDYKRIFGHEIKGIMRGDSIAQAARNNWLYWGAGGVMTKHIAFEYGVAYILAPMGIKRMMPKNLKKENFKNIDIEAAFYESLKRVDALKMYDNFLQTGWTTQLAIETRETLIPEIVRAITLGWASSLEQAKLAKMNRKGGKNAKKK
ncbi:MAG: hypothetical protein MJ154_03595 [Candidatus Saccharibacteria bacterium]|nr:hypothetical protein [Candidatus Saccharibacteria bacterium]